MTEEFKSALVDLINEHDADPFELIKAVAIAAEGTGFTVTTSTGEPMGMVVGAEGFVKEVQGLIVQARGEDHCEIRKEGI